MHQVKNIYRTIVLLLFIGACSETDTNEFYKSEILEEDRTVVKIGEIVLDNSSIDETGPNIGKLRPEFVSNRDHSLFAFFDELNMQIVVTDSQGKVQHVVSKRGRGPGELMSVLGYNFDEENRIVVYDGSQRMIKVFEMDGDEHSDVDIDHDKILVGNKYLYTKDEEIIVPVINSEYQTSGLKKAWQSDLIGKFGYNGILIESFGRYDPFLKNPKSYLVFPHVDADLENNQFLSSHPDRYSLQLYNLETQERIAWFGMQSENFNQTDSYIDAQQSHQKIDRQARDLSWTSGVYFLPEYFLHYFVILTEEFQQTRDHNDKIHYINLYDRNSYNSYGELELPYTLGSVVGNKLYLIEDDNPDNYTIGIYEIHSDG
jgi:hypothetical protein